MSTCLQMSPAGDCPNGPHGPIGEWDVFGIPAMTRMFYAMEYFNGDISKWDVSTATTMSSMFDGTSSFNGDLSKWDVSSVTNMNMMFHDAKIFNRDISTWDVSRVTNMESMFMGALAFTQRLCGPTWVNSQASKSSMFYDSSGSISQTVCWPSTTVRIILTPMATPPFSPQSK